MTSHFIPSTIRDAAKLVVDNSIIRPYSSSAFAIYLLHHVVDHVCVDELDAVLAGKMTKLLDMRTAINVRADARLTLQPKGIKS